MDFVVTDGDTLDEAIHNALQALGVGRDQVTVDILSEGRKGLFGFGAQKARVRATVRKRSETHTPEDQEGQSGAPRMSAEEIAAISEKAQTTLTEIIRLMGVEAHVEPRAGDVSGEIVLNVRAENNALLIGRKGQTLEALEYFVTRIVGDKLGRDGPHIVVDIENYRERRRKTLQDMALRLGEKAKRQRKTVTVDALSAADRRVIHAALQDDPWVTTKSLGQGSYRRLLIIPEGDRKKKDEAKPAGAEKLAVKEAKERI